MNTAIRKHAAVAARCIVLLAALPVLVTGTAIAESSNWNDLGLYGGQIFSIAVDPADSSVLYAGSYAGDGLFASTDGGTTWSTVAGFRNNSVFDIAVDPQASSRIWVASREYVAVSSDGGKTWKKNYFPYYEGYRTCYTTAVSPHDPSGQTAYAGLSGTGGASTYGAVYKTQDGGTTWRPVKRRAQYSVLDLRANPDAPGEVWAVSAPWAGAADSGVIYVTKNNGTTWRQWNSYRAQDGSEYAFGYLDEVRISPSSPLTVYACGNYGIFQKDDGPARTDWLAAGLPESFFTVRALAVPPAGPGTVYAFAYEDTGIEGATAGLRIVKSSDSAGSWDVVAEAPAELIVLEPDPLESGCLYAGSVNHGIFKTEDGALTWQTVNNGIRANTIFDTALSDADPYEVLCGTFSGIYLGGDNGTWQHINDDYTTYTVAFHPEDRETVYSGHDYVIGKTINGGTDWVYVRPTDSADLFRVSSIALSSGQPHTLFAALAFGSGTQGEIVKIQDSGADFSAASTQTVLTTDTPAAALAVHPERAEALWAGTGNYYAPVAPGGVLTSRDGGVTWEETSLSGVVVNAIAVSPSNPDILYAGCGASDSTYSGLYKSTDGGATWANRTRGFPYYFAVTDVAVDSTSSDIVYASLTPAYTADLEPLSGVYISLDGGEYWTQLGLSDYVLYAVDSTAGRGAPEKRLRIIESESQPDIPFSTMYAGTASGLYSSSTAGTGIISGSVTNAVTGEPVDGAVVTSSVGANSVTADGYYLMMVPAGIHTLQAALAGYVPQAAPAVTVSAGTAVEQNLTLQPAPQDNETVCLATSLLSGPQQDSTMSLLRDCRDRLLLQSRSGRALVRLYYAAEKTVQSLCLESPALRSLCSTALTTGLPALEKMLALQDAERLLKQAPFRSLPPPARPVQRQDF